MILLIMGIWMLYNFFTVVFPVLPYIALYHGGSVFVQSLSVLALKWSLPMSFIFMVSGAITLLDRNSKPRLLLSLFGLVISLLLLL